MRIYDVLYSMNTGNASPKASPFDNLLGQALNGGEVEKTTTGNPVSIVTSGAQNAISTILSYSPKQSGSGDPSPINIRPIVPWTEANLTGAGKNLFDKNDDSLYLNAYIRSSAPMQVQIASENPERYRTIICPCNPNTTYTLSKQFGNRFYVGYTHEIPADGVAVYGLIVDNTATEITITTDSSAKYIVSYMYYSAVDSSLQDIIDTLQIEVGSTATTYEQYTQGANNTISLGGSYYGGNVDIERGVLRNTWGYIASYDGEELPGRWISDRDVYSPNASPTIGAEVAYELATSLEITLTPQTVALLAGNNTLWTDGDEVSITYKAKRA